MAQEEIRQSYTSLSEPPTRLKLSLCTNQYSPLHNITTAAMANKSRPKKVKAPYRKYVGGQGYITNNNTTTVTTINTDPTASTNTDIIYSGSMEEPEQADEQFLKNFAHSTLKDSNDIIETPQGLYYYDELNESIVHIEKSSLSNAKFNKLKRFIVNRNKDKNNQEMPRTADSTSSSEQLPIQEQQMTLPWEIQKMILQYSEVIEPSFLVVCKTWYHLCIPLLYYSPSLTSKNFNKFVDAIISNKKKKLGEFVQELDLSTILQSGKNSFVSKLLRRCSPGLTKFTAPQTSFGFAPLISLKACHQLKYLDLGLVSETVKLQELLAAIQNFKHLTHLSFPRSSIDCEGYREFVWPTNLKYLKLSGGITNEFVCETEWPKTIKTLEFSYCPQVDEHAIYIVPVSYTHLDVYKRQI